MLSLPPCCCEITHRNSRKGRLLTLFLRCKATRRDAESTRCMMTLSNACIWLGLYLPMYRAASPCCTKAAASPPSTQNVLFGGTGFRAGAAEAAGDPRPSVSSRSGQWRSTRVLHAGLSMWYSCNKVHSCDEEITLC